MKIQMLASLAGTDYSLKPGDITDMPDKAALRLIGRNMAKPVEPEHAVRSQPEAAAQDLRPHPGRRGRR